MSHFTCAILMSLASIAGVAVGEDIALAAKDTTASEALGKAKLLKQFTESVYPMLTRGGDKSCVSCHNSPETSSLVLVGNPTDDYQLLLENNYFNPRQPDSLLARVTHKKASVRMPEDGKPWSQRDIQILRSFIAEVKGHEKLDPLADEDFPESLLSPYKADTPPPKDNQFITYTQLRGKIKTIFGDDWIRDGRDLFKENVGLFSGADFDKRFNETSEPTTSFLTGLKMVASDVASRAYSQSSGPFAGRYENLVTPNSLEHADPKYREEIVRLYQTILFRSPSEQEIDESFRMIRSVYGEKAEIENGNYELTFLLRVEDTATGLQGERTIRIPVSGESSSVYQEFIDQSVQTETKEGQGFLLRHPLAKTLTFKPDRTDQRVVIYNDGTDGIVSFAGIELTHRGEEPVAILADNEVIQPEGAWEIKTDKGFTSYQDGNNEKGRSRITVPLRVEKPGPYEIAILWRKNPRNAQQVLVEVYSADEQSQVAQPESSPVPPKGEAHFTYDSSDDTRPFEELTPTFRFSDGHCVEISNRNTIDLVTASAVTFVPVSAPAKPFMIDSKDADGVDRWSHFDAGRFKAYNTKGTLIHDGEEEDIKKKKEGLFLKFEPGAAPPNAEWQRETGYKVRLHYPGKNGQDTRVPVKVSAWRSSPIVQVGFSPRAKVSTTFEVKAGSSYTVQHSTLKFSWQQLEGPPVKADMSDPTLRFEVPRRSLDQAAWTALARALIRHPDFLFTRPPSLWKTIDPEEKKKLKLVKVALDLAGRAPSLKELAKIDAGATLADMVDTYLDSQEFRDFYYHRIRLYLESQGTETQDEPVRLWCYVAFNDLPFQQILTADYSVDGKLRKQSRPDYHGRTGLLTSKGFIEGKPGLPHFNYAAQVSMMFLGCDKASPRQARLIPRPPAIVVTSFSHRSRFNVAIGPITERISQRPKTDSRLTPATDSLSMNIRSPG